jgi:transposase
MYKAGISQRKIAAALGVSVGTINADVQKLNENDQGLNTRQANEQKRKAVLEAPVKPMRIGSW